MPWFACLQLVSALLARIGILLILEISQFFFHFLHSPTFNPLSILLKILLYWYADYEHFLFTHLKILLNMKQHSHVKPFIKSSIVIAVLQL